MFSVLLVEDEPLELDVLKNYIGWKRLGIDKVYTARGGRSALACIAEHLPDIVITDIQMPGISGVELAKLIRSEGYSCKIVFLTGYDNFEYAKTAVQVHAEDYILKPFQVDEVEQLVERIIRNIRLERKGREGTRLLRGRMLEQACQGLLTDYEKAAQDYFRKSADELSFVLIGFCGLNVQQQSTIDSSPSVIHSFPAGDLHIAILLSAFQAESIIFQWKEHWHDQNISGVYCPVSVPFSRLPAAMEAMMDHQDKLFFAPAGAFVRAESGGKRQYVPLPDQTVLRNKLVRAITESDDDKARGVLQTMLDQTQSSGKELCIQNACRLYLFLRDRLKKPETVPEFDGEDLVLALSHAERFDVLEELLGQYVRENCHICKTGTDGDLAEWVKRYIGEHYQETCTVEEMAQIVNLSPNYLRKKYKESTGQTILEYLTDVRLQTAADLLKQSRMKVKEISLRVGYENISYFTQLFSKKYGVTPNEYKKMVSR